MNWYDRLSRKPRNVIPNPRDSKRRQDLFQRVQNEVLLVTQFLVFALAFLILLQVS